MSNSSIALEICNALIDGLRRGVIPWHKPWKVLEILNPSHKGGHRFSGINLLVLALYGAGEHLFLGAGQAKKAGLKWASKGNKGLTIIYPKLITKQENGKPVLNGKGKPIMQFVGWGWSKVFPLSAFEGDKADEWRKEFGVTENSVPSHEQADAAFKATGLTLKDGGNGAFYSPAFTDSVYMPDRSRFSHQSEFYRVLFHEVGHALSFHAEDERLDVNYSKEEYSKEELVAEIFANMLASYCGIDVWEHFEGTQAYINHWVDKLTDKPLQIISAANKAQKRFDWLVKRIDEGAKEAEQAA